MIEFILIYITLSIIISIVSHLADNFKGIKEINLICTLCMICVVLIPISKIIPDILKSKEHLNFELETSVQSDGLLPFQTNIENTIEGAVKDLIENEYKIKAEVNAQIDFSDMTAIKLEKLTVIINDNEHSSQISKLLKSIYFCEVTIHENN